MGNNKDFRRGLDGNLARLRKFSDEKGNWFTDLLDRWAPAGVPAEKGGRCLRLAIRDGYLNFYRNGQSVAQVAFDRRGKPVLKLHHKYVGADRTGQAYARLAAEERSVRIKGEEIARYEGPETLDAWIEAAAKHADGEKQGVDIIVGNNAEVIDLEMGLPAWETQAADLGLSTDHPKFAPRMDIVALVPNGSTGWGLGFFEAKLLSNSALRASGEGRSKVLGQLDVYKKYLSDPSRRKKVAAAYQTTCRELTDLWDLAADSDKRAPVLSQPIRGIVEGGDLQVDPQPRLVLFHRCQGVGKFNEVAWAVHREKLVTEGVDIIERGRADDIRLGR